MVEGDRMSNLIALEKKWLEILMTQDFPGRDIIKRQLETVTVTERDIRDSWCDVMLTTTCKESYHPERPVFVPISVDAIQEDDVPVTLMLYLYSGFVAAFAVVNIAGYPLDYENISFDNLVYYPRS